MRDNSRDRYNSLDQRRSDLHIIGGYPLKTAVEHINRTLTQVCRRCGKLVEVPLGIPQQHSALEGVEWKGQGQINRFLFAMLYPPTTTPPQVPPKLGLDRPASDDSVSPREQGSSTRSELSPVDPDGSSASFETALATPPVLAIEEQESTTATPAAVDPAIPALLIHTQRRAYLARPAVSGIIPNGLDAQGLTVSAIGGSLELAHPNLGQRIRQSLAKTIAPNRTVLQTSTSSTKSKSCLPITMRLWREDIVNWIQPKTSAQEIAVMQALVDHDIEVSPSESVQIHSRTMRRKHHSRQYHALAVDLCDEARLNFGYIEHNVDARFFISQTLKDSAKAKRRDGDPKWKNVRDVDMAKFCSQAASLYWIPSSDDRDIAELMASRAYNTAVAAPFVERHAVTRH